MKILNNCAVCQYCYAGKCKNENSDFYEEKMDDENSKCGLYAHWSNFNSQLTTKGLYGQANRRYNSQQALLQKTDK